MDPDCEDNSHLPTFGILLHGDDRPLTLKPHDYVLQNDDHVDENGNKGKVRQRVRSWGPQLPPSPARARSFVSRDSCPSTFPRHAARCGSWATSSCGACDTETATARGAAAPTLPTSAPPTASTTPSSTERTTVLALRAPSTTPQQLSRRLHTARRTWCEVAQESTTPFPPSPLSTASFGARWAGCLAAGALAGGRCFARRRGGGCCSRCTGPIAALRPLRRRHCGGRSASDQRGRRQCGGEGRGRKWRWRGGGEREWERRGGGGRRGGPKEPSRGGGGDE